MSEYSNFLKRYRTAQKSGLKIEGEILKEVKKLNQTEIKQLRGLQLYSLGRVTDSFTGEIIHGADFFITRKKTSKTGKQNKKTTKTDKETIQAAEKFYNDILELFNSFSAEYVPSSNKRNNRWNNLELNRKKAVLEVLEIIKSYANRKTTMYKNFLKSKIDFNSFFFIISYDSDTAVVMSAAHRIISAITGGLTKKQAEMIENLFINEETVYYDAFVKRHHKITHEKA